MRSAQFARRRIRRGVVAFALSAFAASPLAAQPTNWQGPTLTWNTAASWSAGIPTASSTANFTGAATGTIALGTATTGVLNVTGGPYVLNAGTLTIAGAGTNLTTSGTANMDIAGQLSAASLAASLSGGTLRLSNTAAGANANSLTGSITISPSATLTAVFAGTVGTGNPANPTATSTGSNSLGTAAITLAGGTLNLEGALVAGGASGQFYDQNTVATVTSLINADGQLAFGTGRSDFFVRDRFAGTASPTQLTGTLDRSRSNAFFNINVPKTLGTGAPAGTTAVNANQTTARTPQADPANSDYIGGFTFYNDGGGRTFGQGTVTLPAPLLGTTNQINVGQYSTTNHLARFSGYFNVVNGGLYTFDTQSDDASIVYIDGRLVVYNNVDQGVAGFLGGRAGPGDYSQNPVVVEPINLAAGSRHLIEVFYQQGGGGGGLIVNYTGPDAGFPFGVGTTGPISAQVLNGVQGTVNLGNSITLTASSTINSTNAFESRMGALTFNSGLTLTSGTATSTGNALLRFTGTTLNNAAGGTYTVATLGTNDVALGALTNAGGAATIVKTGPNNLILDSLTTPAAVGTLTFDVRGGRLVVASNVQTGPVIPNPLGVGSIVSLNTTGTTDGLASLMLRPINLNNVAGNPAVVFNNRINVVQNGVLEVAPYLQGNTLTNVTLGAAGSTAIDVAATRTLTADIYGGGLNFTVAGNITGSGTILKGAYPNSLPANPTEVPPNNSAAPAGSTQYLTPSIYNGDGTMILTGNNSAFTGLIVVNRGTLNLSGITSLGAASTTIRVSGGITYAAQNTAAPPATINTNAQGGGTLGFQGGVTFPSIAAIVLDGGTLSSNSNNTNTYNGLIQFGSTPASRLYAPLVPVAAATINNGNTGATANFVLGGNIDYGSAARTLNKTGNGPVTLAGPAVNMVTGTTIAIQGGTLNSNNANAFGGLATANLSVNTTLNVGVAQTIGALAGAGTTNLNGNALTVGAANNLSSTYSGVIANGSGAGGSLIKNATGTLTLNGSSTFTGGTRVNAGTLYAASTSAMGAGPVTLAGGTLQLGFPVTTGTPTLSGFGGTGTGYQLNGNTAGFPNVAADVVTLTNNVGNIASSIYNSTQQTLPATGFEARFRYQYLIGSGNPADGFAFVLQNAAAGATALGGAGGGIGYSGVTPSVAIITNLFSNNVRGIRGVTNGTTGGPYTAFLPINPVDNGTGVAGTPLDYVVTYIASTQTVTTQITQGTNTFTTSLQVNIPTVLGGNLAYIGFTGGTGGENARQAVSNFTFTPLTLALPVTYANNVIALAGTTSTVSVLNTVTNLGTLATQAGATLNVVPDAGATANTAYALNFGATSLAGASTLSVANNGTGVGTVTLGALSDGGTAATLTKAGNGSLALNTAAGTTSTGTVLALTGGTLNSGNATALGNATLNQSASTTFNVNATQSIGMLIGAGGTVNLNGNTLTVGGNNTSGVYSGAIVNGSGTGSLTKVGTGTLFLNGANTFTGTTTVSSGTFGGTGSLAGAVNVASGSTLSPGNSPGILTLTGAVALAAGSNVGLELNGTAPGNTPTSHDQIVLGTTGSINLGNANLFLAITGPSDPAFNNANLTVIAGTGANQVSGIFLNLPNGSPVVFDNPFAGVGTPNDFYRGTINYTPTTVVIGGIVPVPEPAHVLLLCGGAAGAIRWWRRRKVAG